MKQTPLFKHYRARLLWSFVEDRQVCFQKSAREQQHCWDSVGQKIFKNNKDAFTNVKKDLINISYCGTFRKEKNKQIWNKKEASPVDCFMIKPLMEPSELFKKRSICRGSLTTATQPNTEGKNTKYGTQTGCLCTNIPSPTRLTA